MTPIREIVEALLSWPKWDSRSYWLAEMVVRLVEERAAQIRVEPLSEALSHPDIDITPEDFAWLKGRVGG